MSLNFGWKANDIRESIWKDDDALKNVPEAALAGWREDGDASHLEPYATTGQPSKITFRALTQEETQMVSALNFQAMNEMEFALRSWLLCFRIAVDFPDAPTEFVVEGTGARKSRTVKERGIRMLSLEFVQHLAERYPEMVGFYGGLVFRASFATASEKKASSPPSTTQASEPPTDAQAKAAAA